MQLQAVWTILWVAVVVTGAFMAYTAPRAGFQTFQLNLCLGLAFPLVGYVLTSALPETLRLAFMPVLFMVLLLGGMMFFSLPALVLAAIVLGIRERLAEHYLLAH